MTEPKKKRTILMDENEANVPKPSLIAKMKKGFSEALSSFHGVKGGVAVDTGPAEFSVGVLKSKAKDALGKKMSKPKLGAKVEFKF